MSAIRCTSALHAPGAPTVDPWLCDACAEAFCALCEEGEWDELHLCAACRLELEGVAAPAVELGDMGPLGDEEVAS
jgi:hypothetical protein